MYFWHLADFQEPIEIYHESYWLRLNVILWKLLLLYDMTTHCNNISEQLLSMDSIYRFSFVKAPWLHWCSIWQYHNRFSLGRWVPKYWHFVCSSNSKLQKKFEKEYKKRGKYFYRSIWFTVPIQQNKICKNSLCLGSKTHVSCLTFTHSNKFSFSVITQSWQCW